jgi:hypothetical protein
MFRRRASQHGIRDGEAAGIDSACGRSGRSRQQRALVRCSALRLIPNLLTFTQEELLPLGLEPTTALHFGAM